MKYMLLIHQGLRAHAVHTGASFSRPKAAARMSCFCSRGFEEDPQDAAGEDPSRGAKTRRLAPADSRAPVVWRIEAGSFQLRDRGRERRVELRRQAVLELPHERDRAVALVAHVRRRAEAPERAVGRAQPGEQHDVRPVLALPDVPLARRAVGGGRGLALPVDQLGADRVVAVARRRREAADALVEREREQVGLRLLAPTTRRSATSAASRRRRRRTRRGSPSRV